MSDSRPQPYQASNSKNPKNSKSFSNYFEMLKLNKQPSVGERSVAEKDSSIQTIKEKLLREAYQLQIEQEQLAQQLKEADECQKELQLARKQLAERNISPIRKMATVAELRQLLLVKQSESQQLQQQLYQLRMQRL